MVRILACAAAIALLCCPLARAGTPSGGGLAAPVAGGAAAPVQSPRAPASVRAPGSDLTPGDTPAPPVDEAPVPPPGQEPDGDGPPLDGAPPPDAGPGGDTDVRIVVPLPPKPGREPTRDPERVAEAGADLPRTGRDAIAAAALGLALIAAGGAFRNRFRERPARS